MDDGNVDDGYEPTKWWRAIDSNGRVWCESSSEQEVRESMRPGDKLQRLYQKSKYNWRTEK